MILLIKKSCPFCLELEKLIESFSDIRKFYVEDEMIIIEEQKIPLSSNIPGLPCLIVDEKLVICGQNLIIDHINKMKLGEV